MIVQCEPKAIHLAHPEIGAPAMAEIVKKWYEDGRWSGYELRFSGETASRHLRFKEIRRLQGDEDDE